MRRAVYGHNKNNTVLQPYALTKTAEIMYSTYTGDAVIEWGDGGIVNKLSEKMKDYTISPVTSVSKNTYAIEFTGDVKVIFTNGLNDIYSWRSFSGVKADNFTNKLNIQDIELFFKQMTSLYSIYVNEYAYLTPARQATIKGDLAKLPNSVERVFAPALDVVDAESNLVLNLTNYNQGSKLKWLKIAGGVGGTSKIKLIGDLSKLPASCNYFYIENVYDSSSITYDNNKVWASSFDTLYLMTLLTDAENDALLIDMASSITTAIGDKIISLKGYRTPASNTALSYLQSLGFTVTIKLSVNKKVLDLAFQNDFIDSSSNSISMVAANANGFPSFVAGRKGTDYAVNFASSKSIVTSTNLPIDTTDRLSFSFWIKTSSNAYTHIMELSNNSAGLSAFIIPLNNASKKVDFYDIKGGFQNIISTTPDVNTNTWVHIAIVSDRSKGKNQSKMYVNNVLAFTQKTASDLDGNYDEYPLYIGSRAGTSYPYVGLLQDLKIYNYPLSLTEINNLYNE